MVSFVITKTLIRKELYMENNRYLGYIKALTKGDDDVTIRILPKTTTDKEYLEELSRTLAKATPYMANSIIHMTLTYLNPDEFTEKKKIKCICVTDFISKYASKICEALALRIDVSNSITKDVSVLICR